MIKIGNLHFSYGKHEVLKGISAQIDAGVLCGLFGPNGSGKTTLFKCCLNFLPVIHGNIVIHGKNTRSTPIEKIAREVAFVPQEHKPPFPYKVKEVVLMGRTPHLNGGMFNIAYHHKAKAYEAMKTLEILHLAETPYSQLSGGQRQLVLIARSIAQETPVLFLDEPTSALDFHNQIKIWEILQTLSHQGKTIVACTHDPNHVSWFCDHVLVMHEGELVAEGHPSQALCEETLNQIYHDTCQVGRLKGGRIILPKTVFKMGIQEE